MPSDTPRKPARRKPTKRAAARTKTQADSYYSKLTRKSSFNGSTLHADSRRDAVPAKAADALGKRDEARADSGADDPSAIASVPAGTLDGFEPLLHGAQRRVYGKRAPKRKRGGTVIANIVGLLAVAAFVGGAIMFWTHRSVHLTVNGQFQKIQVNSSLQELYDQSGATTNPGNLITVSGNLLEEGGGYPFTAAVNGEELTRDALDAYQIQGGERIAFSDGTDRMEEYDVDYREVQPKLVFEGDAGAVSYVRQWGQVGRQEIRTGKASGETADGDWVNELRDCVVVTKNVAPANGEQLVALTFDDGPAPTYTEAYLEILQRYGAKATFFNLSPNVSEHPELTKAIVDSGHQLCSHTSQHLQLSPLSQEDLVREVNGAHDAILDVTGVDTTTVRPPYGDFNQSCWLSSQGTMSVSVLWNQDSRDWETPGVDAIVENALNSIQPGSIILMHDGGGNRDQDLEALPRIIEQLQASGYRLVTIGELLASDPDIPAEIAAGNAKAPEGAMWPTEISAPNPQGE